MFFPIFLVLRSSELQLAAVYHKLCLLKNYMMREGGEDAHKIYPQKNYLKCKSFHILDHLSLLCTPWGSPDYFHMVDVVLYIFFLEGQRWDPG